LGNTKSSDISAKIVKLESGSAYFKLRNALTCKKYLHNRKEAP